MANFDLIERNKSTIVNFGVIILALIIAFQFYRSANEQVGLLIQQQHNEREKNKVIEEIAVLEKKADLYKKVFVKKDLASVVDIISGIAKDSAVKIVSIKPNTEEVLDNHLNSSFLITLNSPSYHALGNFISKIENYKDIYLVSEINIDVLEPDPNTKVVKSDLEVSLKINTISYL